ncbi:MAG: 4'-phosphopantetheinyl transferase superfamily protein [Prevotella sp.]|nr:4'-phosphopantetheinyl transferase superfamily protein [Prevotella sp.]
MIYIDDRINDFDLTAALQQLSAQRREQALRFRYELGQRTCALAYLLLKRALSKEYGITENPVFEYGEHGKPAIVGHPEIFFNLSHCREAVACAVSDRPVGIDVESIRSFKESLVRFTMNEQEVERIMAAERPEVAFIRLWTMKEARLKLTGEGISNDLKQVLSENDAKRYTTVECLQRGYIYTVCEAQQ